MSKLNVSYSIFLFFALSLLSCCKDEQVDDCPQDLFCTEVFVSVTAKVQWMTNDIKRLNSKTILKRTGETIHSDTLNEFQVISVVSDSELSKLTKMGDELILEIYNESNQLLQTENYIIGHDCCHVLKISGPDIITLR